MQKLYIVLLISIVVIATGCPRTLTKPDLKVGKNGKASTKLPTGQINQYLQWAQVRYDCFKQGKKPEYKQEQPDKNQKKSNVVPLPSCSDKAEWLVKKDNNPDVEASMKMGAVLGKQERDDAIEDGLAFIDGNYETFIDDLNNGRSTASFVADVIDLGTSATIGISKGERPLQILGIALTAFRGGRKSASLNFFKEQSTPVLINKMDDNRAQRQSAIIQQKTKPIGEYSMRQGIRDVVAYYNAGTLVRAFTELSKDTAAQAKKSEDALLEFKGVKKSLPITPEIAITSKEAGNIIENLRVALTSQKQEIKDKALQTLQAIYKELSEDEAIKSAFKERNIDENTVDGEKIRAAIVDIRRVLDDAGKEETSEKIEKVLVKNYK